MNTGDEVFVKFILIMHINDSGLVYCEFKCITKNLKKIQFWKAAYAF